MRTHRFWKHQLDILPQNDELARYVTWLSLDPPGELIGSLNLGGYPYQLVVTAPNSAWTPPTVSFPDERPISDCIDSKGHVSVNDQWSPALKLDIWLLMLVMLLNEKGKAISAQ